MGRTISGRPPRDIAEHIEKLERLKNRKSQKRKKIESYKKLTKGEPIFRFKTIFVYNFKV